MKQASKVKQKQNWMSLTHEERVKVLSTYTVDQISADYQSPQHDDNGFRRYLANERRLWEAGNAGTFTYSGTHPTKDVVLGAWRDLDRIEALLELIDNTIDAWFRRRRQYPKLTAEQLNIFIDIDREFGHLIYEDNAGGVSEDHLNNLVVPGYSDTTSLECSIGSYKTGGKKAIFRLGEAVCITTRYWNPAGSSDDAISIQLDSAWMNDSTVYRFPYTKLLDRGSIEKGQTRYVLQLREEPIGNPWYNDPTQRAPIAAEIQHRYSLLMIRNPEIHIHFCDRSKPLGPIDLYGFSGAHGKGYDIRPQQIQLTLKLEHEGIEHPATIEIVLGCRTTTGTGDGSGRSFGIDLYGNNRLFVCCDQDTFASLLPAGAAKNMSRGFVNIHGPNVFVPWDTHKRHLNVDREIMRVITSHRLIRELFARWDRVYKDISGLKVKELIKPALTPAIDTARRDLNIPHRAKQHLDPAKSRGASLKSDVFTPTVKASGKKNEIVTLNLSLSTSEAREVAGYFGVSGDLQDRSVQKELALEAKTDLIARITRSKK